MPTSRRPPRVAAIACALALAAAVTPSWSTVIAPLDLRDLVAAAATVVYGRVIETRAVESPRGVATIVTLGMTAYLKGDGGRTFGFQVPGGQIGRYRTVTVGAPVVAVGDELVVFLTAAADHAPAVIGLSQGLLRVVRASADAAPAVLSPPFSRDGTAQRVVRGASPARLVPLSSFVDDVRTLSAEAARAGVPLRAAGERR